MSSEAMALLRRGSSGISDDNLNSRLQREQAKSGAVTASLAWNDPSDLDLHAHATLADGSSAHVFFRNKQGAGGVLDVDMHARDGSIVDEPVEHIFWESPPAGTYSIRAHLYKKRGTQRAVRFRAVLKREGEEDLSVEGALGVGPRTTECFRFEVDAAGRVQVQKALAPAAGPVAARTAAATRGARPRAAVAQAKWAKGKASAVARGKGAKAQVYKGKKLKTSSGLKREDLTRGKRGKIVSLRKHRLGKANRWAQATAKARAAKGVSGFRLLKKGDSFYQMVKDIFAQS